MIFEVTIKRKVTIHAVHGNPPSSATGRVGAVGQIHLICITQIKQEHKIITMELKKEEGQPVGREGTLTFGRGRFSRSWDQLQANKRTK